MRKEKSTYALTEDCRQLLVLLARKLGLNRTTVIELAVRRMAQAEGVSVPQQVCDGRADANAR